MKILITTPYSDYMTRYFREDSLKRLSEIAEVTRNPFGRQYTRDELCDAAHDADIMITHWGSPRIDEYVLDHCPKLKLIAHAAGSVANCVTHAVYDRGLSVISANTVMARFVAESALGYMIAGSHRFSQLDAITRRGEWEKLQLEQFTLYGAEIGMIGFGTVARYLADLLKPFGCKLFVYDPYINSNAASDRNVILCSLEEAMSKRIVTLHAPKTDETYHMIGAAQLALIPNGGLLINTARAAVLDTEALIQELKTGRIYAVLDVYDEEGAGKVPEELRSFCGNTLLQPHTAAIACTHEMLEAVTDDIYRFARGEALTLTISRRQFELMTKE